MELPPPQVTRAVVERYARLVARLSDELGARPLVLPTGAFFPDVFQPNQKGLSRLLRRMQQHAGLEDVPIRARLVAAEGGEDAHGSCGSGSCSTPAVPTEPVARVVDADGNWTLNVPQSELGHPVALTTNLARALGFVFLAETQEEGVPLEPPVEVSADLAAVALGFGVLLLQGSYIYTKSCGGPSVAQLTKLSCPELAVATALFAAAGRHPAKSASRELETTQRALLDEAAALLDSNPALVDKLRRAPDAVARGEFELAEAKPWLVRLFGKKKRAASLEEALRGDASLDELESMALADPSPQRTRAGAPGAADDDLRSLVAEALESSRADAE